MFLKTDTSPKDGGRRGSRVRSSIDEDVPLTHKTGTVGIVALAIRNKNETKKEREFKVRKFMQDMTTNRTDKVTYFEPLLSPTLQNLDKDVPKEDVKYPSDTAKKNRSPEVLPGGFSIQRF